MQDSPPLASRTELTLSNGQKITVKGVQETLQALASQDVQNDEIVISTDSYSLTKQSFERLSKQRWLNDECLNAYVSLINSREAQRCGPKHPCTFAFNTFFFTMLEEMRESNTYNFRKLQRIVNKKKV